MIGIYNYTVILTYLSVCSTVAGMYLAFSGSPFYAVICLMFSGLCDGFDGKVARAKKDRTKTEIAFGIQLDSLADLIAYGILPVAIGYSVGMTQWYFIPIGCLFVLGALIRLAHFNVNEEEVSKTKEGGSKTFIGLPTTSVSLILPLVYSLRAWCGETFHIIWAGALLVIAFLFVLKLKFVDKPDFKKLMRWIILGIIELILIIAIFNIWKITR